MPCLLRLQVEAKLPAYERRWMRNWLGLRGSMPGVPTMIDAEHVLWTDPDVLFRQPVDTCTLPAAHLMSLGAAVGGRDACCGSQSHARHVGRGLACPAPARRPSLPACPAGLLQKRPGSILDSSIMAVNVDAYAAMQPALLKFAEAQKWQVR